MRTRFLYISVLLVGFILTGCAPGVELSPGPSATELPVLNEAAVSTVAGVQVVAQADAWTGDPAIKTEVTPMRVVIENTSNRPIRLQYSEFALVGANGERYVAIPPFQVEGSVEEPVTVEAMPITDPLFTYDRFMVAPYFADVYPTLTPYADPFFWDPLYYDTYGTVWVERELPTAEMLANALPEGVIMPGGRVDGFVYFEKVDDDLPRVWFTTDVTGATDGDILGRITIPFVTED